MIKLSSERRNARRTNERRQIGHPTNMNTTAINWISSDARKEGTIYGYPNHSQTHGEKKFYAPRKSKRCQESQKVWNWQGVQKRKNHLWVQKRPKPGPRARSIWSSFWVLALVLGVGRLGGGRSPNGTGCHGLPWSVGLGSVAVPVGVGVAEKNHRGEGDKIITSHGVCKYGHYL